jgi:hypothetical protein
MKFINLLLTDFKSGFTLNDNKLKKPAVYGPFRLKQRGLRRAGICNVFDQRRKLWHFITPNLPALLENTFLYLVIPHQIAFPQQSV